MFAVVSAFALRIRNVCQGIKSCALFNINLPHSAHGPHKYYLNGHLLTHYQRPVAVCTFSARFSAWLTPSSGPEEGARLAYNFRFGQCHWTWHWLWLWLIYWWLPCFLLCRGSSFLLLLPPSLSLRLLFLLLFRGHIKSFCSANSLSCSLSPCVGV